MSVKNKILCFFGFHDEVRTIKKLEWEYFIVDQETWGCKNCPLSHQKILFPTLTPKRRKIREAPIHPFSYAMAKLYLLTAQNKHQKKEKNNAV